MKFAQAGSAEYLLRLDPGDDILLTIEQFCQNQEIKNASISGIGSVKHPTLAHYRMDHKKYSEKAFEGIFEIVSITGNVAIFENRPLVHLHVVISDEAMNALGGHLVKGICSATAELVIRDLGTSHHKQMDEAVGLKIWDFN